MRKESEGCFEMRYVEPEKAPSYIAKSEEFLEMAKLAVQNAKYNSAVTGAIHSAISASDALTTSHRGKRASDDHAEALSLVRGMFAQQEYQEVKRRFAPPTGKKNASEHQSLRKTAATRKRIPNRVLCKQNKKTPKATGRTLQCLSNLAMAG